MQAKLISTKLNIQLQSPQTLSLDINNSSASEPGDYSKLRNLPRVNGVTLSGDVTTADLNIISENTTAGWEQNYLYVPKRGEIVIYIDHDQYTDGEGNVVIVPDMKVGDGQVPVVDLPFINEAFKNRIIQALEHHINDADVHVSEEDRMRWNAKLNYITNGETLIFTRE